MEFLVYNWHHPRGSDHSSSKMGHPMWTPPPEWGLVAPANGFFSSDWREVPEIINNQKTCQKRAHFCLFCGIFLGKKSNQKLVINICSICYMGVKPTRENSFQSGDLWQEIPGSLVPFRKQMLPKSRIDFLGFLWTNQLEIRRFFSFLHFFCVLCYL